MTTDGNVQPAPSRIDQRTIADFGEQWNRYTDNSGWYGSVDLLRQIVEPLLPISEIKGRRVAEIGSGSGRIVGMLLGAGAAHVTAIEPSQAVEVLRRNSAYARERVTVFHGPGEEIARCEGLDLVLSIGVLHHISAPEGVVRAAIRALCPGGRMVIWLYGNEGNELYLQTIGRFRAISRRLPHPVLSILCSVLNVASSAYIGGCRIFPLPMRDYVLNVFSRLAWDKRKLVIYDQLNPAYARYYREHEARALLEQAGFTDVKTHHRNGYSWTVVGTKASLGDSGV
jgi:SAM-dependent methyltransferase